MKNSEYKCENTAFHIGECCDTCWNKHPEALPTGMFLGSDRQKDIVKTLWVDDAREAGFTWEQARFLYEKFIVS